MSHMFADWSRVEEAGGFRKGVVVWDPTTTEYRVLWDDNGWDSYTSDEAKRILVES